MRVVVAPGGNALLRRGQPMTEQNQRENVKVAASALADIAREHQVVITHGNGPHMNVGENIRLTAEIIISPRTWTGK